MRNVLQKVVLHIFFSRKEENLQNGGYGHLGFMLVWDFGKRKECQKEFLMRDIYFEKWYYTSFSTIREVRNFARWPWRPPCIYPNKKLVSEITFVILHISFCRKVNKVNCLRWQCRPSLYAWIRSQNKQVGVTNYGNIHIAPVLSVKGNWTNEN